MKKLTILVVIFAMIIPLYGMKTELNPVLGELEKGINQFQKRNLIPAPRIESIAQSLGTMEAIFDFVKGEIRFEGYVGRLRGPEGTFFGRAGNAIDQSELLILMLGMIGQDCRYARGRLDVRHIKVLTNLGDSLPQERDLMFGDNPAPSESQKELKMKLADHYWVQVKQGDQWIDLDPCFIEHKPGQKACLVKQTQKNVPNHLAHRVKMEVKYRISSSGRKSVLSMLSKEFIVADLYGKQLTLVSLVKGNDQSGLFVLDEVQPVLSLEKKIFPGSVFSKTGIKKSEGGKTGKAAGRMGGIFDNLDKPPAKAEKNKISGGDFQVVSKWVDVTLLSPGWPADRFKYTVFDAEKDKPDAEKSARLLGKAVAFGFSPAQMTKNIYQEQILAFVERIDRFPHVLRKILSMPKDVHSSLKLPLPQPVKDFNETAVNAERALAWMVVQYYIFQSDRAVVMASKKSGIAAYFDRPRAIIASLGYLDGKTIFDLDLRRNQCRFVAPDGRPGGWEKNLGFLRGLHEARLEGAVLRSFAGIVGLTTGDVFHAAFKKKIPMRWITKTNRGEINSFLLDRESKTMIIQAVNKGNCVFVPVKPVMINNKMYVAWYQLNEKTGFLDGVFSNGKHQSMVESVQIHFIGCIVNSAKGYFFSIEMGFVFGLTAGLNHFLNCVMANPAASCMGSADVCKPAIKDAKAMCTEWGFYAGFSSWNPLPLIGAPDLLTLTYGDPCEKGAILGLMLFGCK